MRLLDKSTHGCRLISTFNFWITSSSARNQKDRRRRDFYLNGVLELCYGCVPRALVRWDTAAEFWHHKPLCQSRFQQTWFLRRTA